MYHYRMKRENLKSILLNFYTDSASNHILRGIRKPSYDVIVELDKKHGVPFDVWTDIKSYLKNDTKTTSKESTTPNTAKVSA